MPKKRSDQETATGKQMVSLDAERTFKRWINAYENRHIDEEVTSAAIAKDVGINAGVFSEIRRGKRQALIEQCVRIARRLEVPVEEVLRVEGYPDIAQLMDFVEHDPTEHNPREREYILNMLYIAQRPMWQKTQWQKSTYRRDADEILATDLPPYDKALRYANVVYDWGHNPDRDTPHWERRTDEIRAIVS